MSKSQDFSGAGSQWSSRLQISPAQPERCTTVCTASTDQNAFPSSTEACLAQDLGPWGRQQGLEPKPLPALNLFGRNTLVIRLLGGEKINIFSGKFNYCLRTLACDGGMLWKDKTIHIPTTTISHEQKHEKENFSRAKYFSESLLKLEEFCYWSQRQQKQD